MKRNECVFINKNGDEKFILVRVLRRRLVSIRNKVRNKKTYFSEYWVDGNKEYLNAENISVALKFATTALNYPYLKGIPIDRVETHSLRSG